MTHCVDFCRGFFPISGFFGVSSFGRGLVQFFSQGFKNFRRLIAENFSFFVFFGHGADESLKNRQTSNVQIETAIVNANLNVSLGNLFRSVEITNDIRPVCSAGNDSISLLFAVADVFYNVVFHGVSYRGVINIKKLVIKNLDECIIVSKGKIVNMEQMNKMRFSEDLLLAI